MRTLQALRKLLPAALPLLVLWATPATAAACTPGVTLPGCADEREPPAYSQPAQACPVKARRPGGVFVGLSSDDAYLARGRYRDCELARQARSGVEILRMSFHWSLLETAPDTWDYARYDDYMAAVASHGLGVLPVLFTPPPFRSSAPPTGAKRGFYPPSSNSAMAAYARRLVRRYGPGGTFWAMHPELPYLPVRSWQVWNEPNLRVYWRPKPSAAAYAAMLRSTARAVKIADPGARIVSAGVPESDSGIPFDSYVRALDRAGGIEAIDTLAIHPYSPTARGTVAAAQDARRLLDSLGHRDKRLWITELGWATSGPRSEFRGSRGQQAARIEYSLTELHRLARKLKLTGVVYYSWRDTPSYPGSERFWGRFTGLFDSRGKAKPGFAAFSRAALKQSRP